MKAILLPLLFILLIGAAYAETIEPIYDRVGAANLTTRIYTFQCFPPATAELPVLWDVREGPNVIMESSNGALTLTLNLSKDVVYHIGCRAFNGTGANRQLLLYDHHIDLRKSIDPIDPILSILSTNGREITARCLPPVGTTNYELKWFWNKHNQNIQLTQFTNQNTITTTAPSEGLWEIACGTFDKDTSFWSQDATTMDFFSSGPAYVPTADGCVPGQNCPWKTQAVGNGTTTPSNTSNSSSNVCVSSVSNIAASCNGGTITSDTNNGCRTITCANGANNLAIMACDKTGFFEMYRQSGNGNALSICLGATCMSDAGYMRSPNFPICTANTSTNNTNTSTVPNTTTNTTVPNTTANTTTNATTCYTSLNTLPPTCNGQITSDTFNGCRTVACSNAGGSLQILACDKTSGFEMYKQAQTGSGVQICLAGTCIKDGGYAKSTNYPICVASNTTNSTGNTSPATNNTTVPNTTTNNATTCATSMSTMAATCTGGTITSDTNNGCRTIVCGNTQVLACDKSGFFEMYKQSGSGVRICIGTTCIENNGYAKSSNFPLCTGTPTNTSNATTPTNTTNTTNSTANSTALTAAVSIAPWFPQGKSYVFYCNTTGFTPTFYDFSFGNGNVNSWRAANDVYYTYPTAGTYNVTCTARNATVQKSSSMMVQVQ